jgi:hypothetical protein
MSTERAQASCARRATAKGKAFMQAEVENLYSFARQHIRESRRSYSPNVPAESC